MTTEFINEIIQLKSNDTRCVRYEMIEIAHLPRQK